MDIEPDAEALSKTTQEILLHSAGLIAHLGTLRGVWTAFKLDGGANGLYGLLLSKVSRVSVYM